MATVSEHYSNLLAPIYSWMVGGVENAFAQGALDLESWMPSGAVAVDLGAGFGMHTVPLARAGWKVLAMDSSHHLANELRGHTQGLKVRSVVADLLDFPQHLAPEAQADFILCMGDTLAHLPGWDALDRLARRVASSLSRSGRFMATFRDYSVLPHGNARFIPVRSDQNRILMCFLEEHPGHVVVHDLLYEREGEKWNLTVSTYNKLRLAPEDVCSRFAAANLNTRMAAGPGGMVRLVADA